MTLVCSASCVGGGGGGGVWEEYMYLIASEGLIEKATLIIKTKAAGQFFYCMQHQVFKKKILLV